MQTEDLKENVEDITTHIGDYLDTLLKVTTINITQKAANTASVAISVVVGCILGLFVLFFAGLGLAWWLGNVVNSRTGGFMIVAGFYLLVGLLFVLLRKQIIFPYIRNTLIRKIYE